MQEAIAALCSQADVAVRDGINIIILSDRRAGADRIPIPSLLACAAVHHHLIREGLRTSVGLVIESGEPREVHHFACLAGYGAEAINPYLAFETLIAMKSELPQKLDDKEILKRYIKSIDKGLLKVMSKMGISTYQSYCGAQIFDAVGLKSEFVATFFTGTATRIEGVGLDEIAEEAVRRHRDAFSDAPIYRTMLDVGGDYAVRVRGEDHVWNAATVAALQHAVRGNSYEKYRQYAGIINEQSEHLFTIRGLFRIKSPADEGRAAEQAADGEQVFRLLVDDAGVLPVSLQIAAHGVLQRRDRRRVRRGPRRARAPRSRRRRGAVDRRVAEGVAVPAHRLFGDLVDPDALDAGWLASEEGGNELRLGIRSLTRDQLIGGDAVFDIALSSPLSIDLM